MKQPPDGYTPLTYFQSMNAVDPSVLQAALAVGALQTIMHEGELWVNYRGADVWLAAEPASPELFAWLMAPAKGRASLSPDSAAETGDDG